MSSEEPKKVDDDDEVSVTFKDLVSTISVFQTIVKYKITIYYRIFYIYFSIVSVKGCNGRVV